MTFLRCNGRMYAARQKAPPPHPDRTRRHGLEYRWIRGAYPRPGQIRVVADTYHRRLALFAAELRRLLNQEPAGVCGGWL